MPDFLLEIGTEEIPDWMIEPALEDLRSRYKEAFATLGGSEFIVDGTPRRLVLLAKEILDRAPDIQTVIPGPYVSAGAKAAEGFARKSVRFCGRKGSRRICAQTGHNGRPTSQSFRRQRRALCLSSAHEGTSRGRLTRRETRRSHCWHPFPQNDVLDRERWRALHPAHPLDCRSAR